MTDTYRTQGLRKQLVEELKKKGIQDTNVLSAIALVPRHFFLSSSLLEHAYNDVPLPIACKQTISQPYTVARQTELLEVKKNLRILEIGTGSGYQAAILHKMEARVYTIERHRELYESAKQLFQNMSYAIGIKYGDGYKGWEEFAPYDRILITCGAAELPQNLLKQLRPNGILVAPIGESEQIMTKVLKLSEDEFETTTHGNYRFVPMLRNAQ